MTIGVAVGAAVVLAVSCAQASTPRWRVAAVYPQTGAIASASASSAANAWAVGQSHGIPCDLCLFTSHWNGKKWQTIAQPKDLINDENHIVVDAAVAATAAERAWVFVFRGNEELGTSVISAVEWTGTSWSAVHNFALSYLSYLGTAIAAGPGDVWGFGTTGTDSQTPWAFHYNGKNWSRVAISVSVSQGSGSAAAGDWVTGTVAAQPRRVEVLHWSKGAWRNVALPAISVPKGEQMLPGLIAAATPASVFATVSVGPPVGVAHVTTVLLHWNGRAWSKLPVPKGVSIGGIDGLASDGHGGFWMASYTVIKPGVNPSGLVMYHYSGGHWTHVPGPVKSGFVTNLFGRNMELIPGTRSVLAGATLFKSGGFEGAGAVLEYGP